MSSEAFTQSNSLPLAKIIALNQQQTEQFESKFIHPRGMLKIDMVPATELVPLVDSFSAPDFTDVVMGRADISQLQSEISCPDSLLSAMLEMHQYSQTHDQEAENVIVTANQEVLEILQNSRKFGIYSPAKLTYLSGPGIYIPQMHIICRMHSHPPGLQMLNDLASDRLSLEQLSLQGDAMSLADIVGLFIDTKSLGYESTNSTLLVGNTLATLIARTQQSPDWIEWDDWETIKRLYAHLEDITAVNDSLPITQQNINNLKILSNNFDLAVYILGVGNGSIENRWREISTC